MMLLEAQLEKQLESITISQTYADEMSQVNDSLAYLFFHFEWKCKVLYIIFVYLNFK